MARGVQITIETSLRGRCRFVESLKGIMLNIFTENERNRLYICIIVEQQYSVYLLKSFIRFSVGMRVSDI